MQRMIWLLGLLCIFLCALPLDTSAQGLPDLNITPDKMYSVAIFPQSIPIYLTKDIPPKVNIDVSVVKKALSEQIKGHPYLNLISFDEIEKSFKTSDILHTEAFMQAEIDMNYAQTFISGMNYMAAIDILQRVTENYKKSLVQYYRPSTVAQAYQQLAYALISQYEENPDEFQTLIHSARLAFVELIRLAPYLVMLEGRQAHERVVRYDEALELFLNNDAYRQTAPKDADALARKIGADIILMVRLVQQNDGNFNLEIDEYHAKTQKIEYHQKTIDFNDHNMTSEKVGMDAAWLMSRSYDCLDVPLDPPPPEKQWRGRFFAELGFSYSSYLGFPTEQILPNLGGHLLVSYLIDPYVFVRAGFEALAVISDSSRELYDTFQVYQFPIHVGMIKFWNWFGLFFAVGVSFSFSTPFAIAHSTICKTFGRDDLECGVGDVAVTDSGFALSIDTLLGMKFGLDPFYFTVEGTANLTAYPMLDEKSFRFPVGLRAGIEYWF